MSLGTPRPAAPSPPSADDRNTIHLQARLIIWIALTIILLPGQLLWLWFLRDERLLAQESTLIWGQLALACATIALLALLKTTPRSAIRLAPRTSALIVVGGTLLLQAAAVLLLAPVLSDDLFRYRLDGRTWLTGQSPYATPPAEFLSNHTGDPVDRLVPYRDWRTIYPPASQVVFAALRWLDDRLVPPAAAPQVSTENLTWRQRLTEPAVRRHTVVFRAAFALFAVAAVALLASTLARACQSVWWAALLGWNPLLTLECGGTGHQDAIGLFLLAATLCAARARRFKTAAVALALAAGIKPVAILLLPFLWRTTHEELSFRGGRRILLVFVAALATIFVPPLLWQHGWIGLRDTLHHFGRAWEANGMLYQSVKTLLGAGDAGRQMERAKDAARLLAAVAGLAIGLFLWQARARLAEAGYWLFIVLLLCAPVAYPWYLIWVLAFVPLLRGPQGYAALIWSATMAMSYTVWRDAPRTWSVPPAWLAAEQLPVLLALAIELTQLARVRPMSRVATSR